MDRVEERRAAVIRYVIDASSMGPILLRDEAADAVAEVMRAVHRGECVAPAHWRFEVANMILTAERRGRIETAAAQDNLADLMVMPIAIDEGSLEHAFSRTSDLAR